MLSNRILNLESSATLAINQRVLELKKQGKDIISFGVGEPNLDVPDEAKEAVIAAARGNFSRYTPTDGIPELKQAIIKKLKEENNLEYGEKNIIASCGAKQSLYNIFQTIINPGDEVLVPAPYWVSYTEQIKLAGGVPVIINAGADFILRAENIAPCITSKTKALVLNSPNNPTGAVMPQDGLKKIAKLAVLKNILIISDEVYEYFIYEGEHFSIASFGGEIKKRTIVVNAVSKSFAMTGWRLGYAAGPEEIVAGMKKLQEQTTGNPSSLSQRAAVAALGIGKNWFMPRLFEFKKKRDIVCDFLQKAGIDIILPAGAFYVFFKHANECGSVDFCKKLLEYAGVALVPGAAFGDDRCARLSYALSEDLLRTGLERMAQFLAGK